jgi:hypothetical protein
MVLLDVEMALLAGNRAKAEDLLALAERLL